MAKKVASKNSVKKQLIARLIAKASLDFKCCGHGKDSKN
jgi:hypothetical protein